MEIDTECPHCGDTSVVTLDGDLNDEDGEMEIECNECDEDFTITIVTIAGIKEMNKRRA